MILDEDRAQEAYFVWAQVGGRRFCDFTYALTAVNARREFSDNFDIPVQEVGAMPLDQDSEEVKRIMASKGHYISHNPGAKSPKLKSKSGKAGKLGKGSGSPNKGLKGKGY